MSHPSKRPAAGPRASGPVLEAHYQFLLWLTPTVEKFPRTQKFLIGDRMQTAALNVYECLITATYRRDRLGFLRQANLELEKLRLLMRLAKDLQHLSLKKYEYGARQMHEIGSMVGGWMKRHGEKTQHPDKQEQQYRVPSRQHDDSSERFAQGHSGVRGSSRANRNIPRRVLFWPLRQRNPAFLLWVLRSWSLI